MLAGASCGGRDGDNFFAAFDDAVGFGCARTAALCAAAGSSTAVEVDAPAWVTVGCAVVAWAASRAFFTARCAISLTIASAVRLRCCTDSIEDDGTAVVIAPGSNELLGDAADDAEVDGFCGDVATDGVCEALPGIGS